jgi:HEPN domain-containing protein
MSEKPVDKELYKNYLQKAEEMLEEAKHSLNTSRYNAAVVESIHSAINSIDALAVFYFGRRHGGGHESALDTIKGALDAKDFAEMSRQFADLMILKNQAEYQPKLMRSQDASIAVKRATRILSSIQEKLPS